MVHFKIAGELVKPEMDMQLSDTIYDLKLRIEMILGVRPERQTLFFGDETLEDNCPINCYKFGDSATIDLVVEPLPAQTKFKIWVKSSTNEEQMKVTENTTVADLKRKIQRRWSISTNYDLTLTHLGVEMIDVLPLSRYHVYEGCSIEVELFIQPR